jgi:predicted nucleotidyltransferase
MNARKSTFAPLRRRERERRIALLRQRLRDTLGTNDCSVWLYSCGEAFGYGSLARGDWDGYSDIDLLVVGTNQDEAERAADQLIEALVGDDVLGIDHERWQAMAISPSPHWRAIRAQAIHLYPQP